ncbi:putative nucleotidyltransferase substrate binding domain-containing protein [Geotalea toluenoxydans]|uniref:putative nucleotidyltransferase substrate binding domain-containing protein n=1 Tax=Geotalea toluenoxydans TaxID=421624 RepID=UPI000A50B8F2|nr:putative nucleotidyltransferase substrate binding domain-containing protein [Geotalea toluenoxydans]
MPSQNVMTEESPEAVINTAMEKVLRFLPLLEREESLRFLRFLSENVSGEIDRINTFSTREIELRQRASVETDFAVLTEIHDSLNELELERFLKTLSVPALHRNCTDYRDLLAGRVLELVSQEMERSGKGAPPLSFALISMGSDGREEQTLITDQDYLIVYEDGGGEVADNYFREFSEILVEKLAQVGFKKCTGDIMPTNQTWRGSLAQWKRRLLAIVRYEFADYAKNLMDLIVLSDARYVAGERELADQLVSTIRAFQQDYFQVLWGMAKAATEMKLALGFLKRLWTEGSGDHKGEFNLKLLAWAPLVMNVRILAINQAIPATNTLQRIEFLEKEKSLSHTMAVGLKDAYHILTRHRILLQIKVIKGIEKDSYHLNPYQLPTEERERIRHALLRIEELQKTIHVNFSIM